MSGVLKFLNQKVQIIKLAYNKQITALGLKVFTHNKRLPNIITKKNISYGDNKLQKYDVIMPKCTEKNLPIVFYVHGGAWCGGDKYGYTLFCEKLAKQNYVVVNINYRLMPEVSVNDCTNDCVLAIKHFLKNSKQIIKLAKQNYTVDKKDVFMAGDSAGAHIVSLIAGKNTSGKLKLKITIKALGLYYGVYNFEHIDKDPSPIMNNLDDYWKSIQKSTKKLYAGISTTNYVTKDFPPCFVTSGEIDKLHFQTEVFVRLLRYNNVEVDYLDFDANRQDGRHAFLNAPFLMSAKQAFYELSKFFVRKRNYEKEW